MTSSGTFNFAPAASELVLTAFSRCGKDGTDITPMMLRQAAQEANLLNIEWSNRGYLLWKQETIQFPAGAMLTQGVAQYALPATTLMVTLAWRELNAGVATAQTDIIMGPLSATEYKSITNKTFQGPPNSYWYDRQITPVMNLWPVPDANNTYTAFCEAFTQLQDVVLPGGVTIDAPWRFLDAFTAGLAIRLAVHFAPERLPILEPAYEKAWNFASGGDVENRPLMISPDFSTYFRM